MVRIPHTISPPVKKLSQKSQKICFGQIFNSFLDIEHLHHRMFRLNPGFNYVSLSCDEAWLAKILF